MLHVGRCGCERRESPKQYTRHRAYRDALVSCTFNSETATATTAAEMVTVRKDDLVDILRQWPEVMAELTIEAEHHFQEVQVCHYLVPEESVSFSEIRRVGNCWRDC